MSRLAKKPIIIPEGVTVTRDGDTLTVKGPKATLEKNFLSDIKITISGNEISLEVTRNSKDVRALLGTYAAHIHNMIDGSQNPFEKKLIIEGTGYKAKVQGSDLVLSLGYSHPINLKIPEGLTVVVENEKVSIKGHNKEEVGQFAAVIRDKRPPEPYKGKGVRYDGEVIERKQGKKGAA